MSSPAAKGIKSFMDDLEKAKALSLETLELDRLRREHRRNQREFEDLVRSLDDAVKTGTQANKSVSCKNETRNGTCDIITTNVEPRSRPKPEIAIHASSITLPPPPRKQGPSSGTCLKDVPSVTDEDLMSFHGRLEQGSRFPDANSSLESLFLDSASSQTLFTHQVDNGTPPATANVIVPPQGAISGPLTLPYPILSSVPTFSLPYLTGPLPLSQWNFPPPPAQPVDGNFNAGHRSSGRGGYIAPPPRPFLMPPPIPCVPPRRTVPSASSPTIGVVDDPLSVLKNVGKKADSNLIDLSGYDFLGLNRRDGSYSLPASALGHDELLINFDPLLTNIGQVNEVLTNVGQVAEVGGNSKVNRVEDKGDMQVMETVKVNETVATEPAVELRKQPPSRPPSRSSSIAQSAHKERHRRVERVSKSDTKMWRGNNAMNAFWESVVRLRQEFQHDDDVTNPGCVISPVLESLREESMSMRLTIATDLQEKPIAFTCDVNTSIEHIINNVVFTILDDSTVNTEEYILKVHGLEEYLTNNTVLADYEYVLYCQKFAEDVRLTLLHIGKLRRPLLRTVQDDKAINQLKAKSIYPPSSVSVTQNTLDILMGFLDKEILKMKEKALKTPDEVCKAVGVIQAVKAISAVTCQIETKELKSSIEKLDYISTKTPLVRTSFLKSSDSSDNPCKANEKRISKLSNALENVKNCVHNQLNIIRSTFNIDIELPQVPSSSCKTMTEITQHADTILVHVASVYRLLPYISESYDSFTIKCDLYHGIRLLTETVETLKPVSRTICFYEHLVFDELVEFRNMQLRRLPRETRLCCTLYGVRTVSSEGKETGVPTKCPLAWGALQLFNFEGIFAQGKYLCGMWPVELDFRLGPALCNMKPDCPVLEIEIPTLNSTVIFPPLPESLPSYRSRFEDLENDQQQRIMKIIELSSCSTSVISDRKILWESRHFLYEIPQALPKVLLGAIDWDYECLSDVYSMLRKWEPMNQMDAIELLLPCFPDVEVRKMAIMYIRNMGPDELCDYLPQLVQAFKYETYEDSAIAKFLLERSLTNIRVAHNLYWLLKQSLDDEMYGQRIHLLFNALMAICGKALRERLKYQDVLMDVLSEIAKKVKTSKDKMKTLKSSLEDIHYLLSDTPTSLPLTPSHEVVGIIAKDCSYFNSNTLPLKLAFKSLEIGANPLEAIYKEGDDLKQDMLTLQMIRIMDKLWLKEGLDLRIVIFKCVSTGPKKGILELVKGSETLRKIHVDHGGLTGSFKEDPIADWLQRHNPTELEYNSAVENFTYSCAGYAVATYILGICDRHNDNIMVKTSGHMFHIDFAKFLGDAQTFGTIKRDRVPFVLTSDMAYVINGGDKPSSKFQNFVDLCCQAFNIIRRNGNLFLNLFSLMVSSGIPGVTSEAVNYIQNALLPKLTESEADIAFCRMIEESLKNTFTQINFFMHNIAQWKLSRENNNNILSFIPKTYTLATDGKITSWGVIQVQKRYEPAKHYVYILKVSRETQVDPTLLVRTYREFCEFHQKLFKLFPHAKYYSNLSAGGPFGRSNIRQVAEKRKAEIESFLRELDKMADEIKHCDLVYTFFHPLLRDQQDLFQNDSGMPSRMYSSNEQQGISYGQVQLSIVYKNNTLFIMVRHARDLSSVKGTTPDPYVKTYLLPDDAKITKQKTKVVRKSCHPTFMELLVYNKPLEVVQSKVLKVSVWDNGRMAENCFLGQALVKLSKLDLNSETVAWYQLRDHND